MRFLDLLLALTLPMAMGAFAAWATYMLLGLLS